MATPLMIRSPLLSPTPATGATPVTLLEAVAETPVWVVTALMAVALAAALPAVTPASLVATEAATWIPLMVKSAPVKALVVTFVLLAW